MRATGTDGDAPGTPSAFVLVSTGTLTGTDGDAPPRGRTPPLSVGGVFVLDTEPEPWERTDRGRNRRGRSVFPGRVFAVPQGTALPTWLGWPGVVIGAGLAVGSAEFLGPNEERGWGLAGAAIPVLYIAWSVWLLAIGVALIA